MADSTVAALSAASALAGTELFYADDGAADVKVTATQIKTWAQAGLSSTYQPLDADLTAIAGLTSAANKLPYFTGSGTAQLADLSSYGRTLINLADEDALEALLDTLANLTSVQGRTILLADAGADALWGWDDSANQYANLSAADAGAAIKAGIIESFIIACSDETTALTTGTAKVTFRMPYAFTLTGIKASLSTAQTSGSILTVDVKEAGTTILSTKITIDNSEKTTVTAATPAVISDSALASDAEMTVNIDQVGDGTAKGLKVTLIGHQ